jgi:hypothetical protein
MDESHSKSIAARWLLPVAAAAALIPLFLYYRTVYPSPDQSLFDYLAWMNINGRAFYAEGFEQNWPGALLLHELATRLFGAHSYSFRTLDFLLMVVATIFVAWHWIRRGLPVAGWIFAYTYPVIYATSGRWMAGERDAVAMNLLLIAVVLLLRAEPPELDPPQARDQTAAQRLFAEPLIAAFLGGALVAFSMLIRPTYLFFAGAAGGMLIVRAITTRSVASVLRTMIAPGLMGFAAVVAIVVIAGLAAGNLDDWYVETIRFNVEAYQVVESRQRLGATFLRHLRVLWPWLAPIATVGLISIKDIRQRPELRYGIALLLTVLVSFVVQNKGFGYHLGGLIPLFTLAVAMGLDTCIHWARQDGRKLWLVPAFVVGSLLAVGLMRRLENVVGLMATKATDRPDAESERNAIVAILRCETGPRDLVFQWGRLSDILYRAERLPASRFVSTPALNLLTGQLGREWMSEFARDLRTNQPRMVVTDNVELPVSQVRAPETPAGMSQAEAILRQDLRANYQIRFVGEHLTLFERRGVPPLRQCA